MGDGGMSTLKVDTINEKTTGNGVAIPGHVIQFLSQEITAIATTASTSLVASGFTLTITPKSAASKIKVAIGFNGIYQSAQNTAMKMHLYKNGSFLAYLDDIAGYGITGLNPIQNANPTHVYVDSPSTTSATTYAIYIATGSGTLGFNNYATGNNKTRSWFTVEEIAQ